MLLDPGGKKSVTLSYYVKVMARSHGITKAKGLGQNIVNNILEYQEYTFSQFCHLFAGIPGKLISELLIIIFCYGCLWAYVSMFACSVVNIVHSIIFCSHLQLFEMFASESCDMYQDPSQSCVLGYVGAVLVYAVCTA